MVFARAFSRQLSRPASSLLAGAATPHFAHSAAPTRFGATCKRTLTASSSRQGKVLLVLYDVSRDIGHKGAVRVN
jgi:formate dehydrogenase